MYRMTDTSTDLGNGWELIKRVRGAATDWHLAQFDADDYLIDGTRGIFTSKKDALQFFEKEKGKSA